MTAENWVNVITIPLFAGTILSWLVSLATQRYTRAWSLSYTGQGVALTASVCLLGCGDWQSGILAGVNSLAFAGTRLLLTTDGLRPWRSRDQSS